MSRRFNDYYFETGQYLLDCAEWVDIPDYPGYQACREGYIQKGGHIVKFHKGDVQGHLNVRLRKNGKQKEEYVHRLIAKTFIRNEKCLPIVRHLDDDKDNNRVENLAWGTMKDNHDDAVRNGTYKPFSKEDREKSYKTSRTPVIAKNLNTGKERYFKSQAIAARFIGAHSANVYKVLIGERKHTQHYSFRYAEGGDKND